MSTNTVQEKESTSSTVQKSAREDWGKGQQAAKQGREKTVQHQGGGKEIPRPALQKENRTTIRQPE